MPSLTSLQASLVEAILQVDIFFTDEDTLACAKLTKQQKSLTRIHYQGISSRDTIPFMFENGFLDTRK